MENRINEIMKRQEEIEKVISPSMDAEEFKRLSAEYNKLDKELHELRMANDPEYKTEYEAWQAEGEKIDEENKELFEKMDAESDEKWQNLVSENKKFAAADKLLEKGDLWGAIAAMS